MPSAEDIKNAKAAAFAWRFSAPIQRATESHQHGAGQIFSLDSGLALLETSAGTWLFPPHRCGWIPPGEPHSLRSYGAITGWSLYLSPDLSNALPGRPSVLSLSTLMQEIVLRIAEWDSTHTLSETERRLVAVLCDEMKRATQQPLYLPMPRDERLRRLVSDLSQRPDDEKTLDHWAHWIGMSTRSLTRNFQLETGMTFGQWRHHARLLQAMEKLSSGMSVTETCFAVGYNSVSAFIAAFKQTMGVTPATYLRNQSPSP
jgi:AraC-like DNA-binding protein